MSLQIAGAVGAALEKLPLVNPLKADLQLTRMDEFMKRLGKPQERLPPVLHVAGTNGKGSTCAFLRAGLEAAGLSCHVTTSPHLVRVHERFRLNGVLADDATLLAAIDEAGKAIGDIPLSIFEFLMGLAFLLFAQKPADAVIIEVGLGGRLDATNILPRCAAAGVARLSYDHQAVLGESISAIAFEKAGIFKPGCAAVAAAQPDARASNVLRRQAHERGCSLFLGGRDWQVQLHAQGFSYNSQQQHFLLPQPNLLGDHQIQNAGLAIAMLEAAGFAMTERLWCEAIQKAEWPGRLQKLGAPLAALLPAGSELWLDGGHNDSAGAVLAQQAQKWRDADDLKLFLICGMLNTKRADDFLAPLAPYTEKLYGIAIPDEAKSLSAESLRQTGHNLGMQAAVAENLRAALADIAAFGPVRVLICGSLYLAGKVLAEAL